MDFINLIVHGSREIRSTTRRYGSGAGRDTGPPVIDLIHHEPGFWAAYGLQTLISGLVGLAGVGLGYYLVIDLTSDNATSLNRLLLVPAGLMVLLGLLLPIYFARRYRQLQQVFQEAEHAPADSGDGVVDLAVDAAGSNYVVVQRHPNVGRFTDGTLVTVCGLALISLGVLQAFGGYLWVEALDYHGAASDPAWRTFGIGMFVKSVVNIGVGVALFQHRLWALVLALASAVAGIVLAAVTAHPLLIGVMALEVLIVGLGIIGFRRLHDRIAAPEKRDPLEAYYHNLMLLLVRVMRADGYCDRRERAKIARLCNDINLSAYEQDYVAGAANREDEESLQTVVARYLDAAHELGLPNPEVALLISSYAVAGADGKLVPKEAAAVERLAHELGLDTSALAALHRPPENLDAMTPEQAAELLNVEPGATPEQVETAYYAISGSLEAVQLDQLGSRLVNVLKGHLLVVERAYDLLSSAAPPPAAPAPSPDASPATA